MACQPLVNPGQRRIGKRKFLRRNGRDCDEDNRGIEKGCQRQRDEQSFWQRPPRIAYFFSNIHHMFKTNEGKDGNQRCRDEPGPWHIAHRDRHFLQGRAQMICMPQARHDNREQTADFNCRHESGQRHRLRCGERGNHAHAEHDRDNENGLWCGPEDREITSCAHTDCGRRDGRSCDNKEPRGERQPFALEASIDIGGFTRSHRQACA